MKRCDNLSQKTDFYVSLTQGPPRFSGIFSWELVQEVRGIFNGPSEQGIHPGHRDENMHGTPVIVMDDEPFFPFQRFRERDPLIVQNVELRRDDQRRGKGGRGER